MKSVRFATFAKIVLTLSITIVVLAGCQMTAPINTWKAGSIPRTGMVRVAVAPVGVASRAMPTNDSVSMDELQKAAKTLESSIVATTPRPNPLLLTVTPDQLATASQIQLVSYDNQPNETATVGAARNTNSDLMLQANVVFAHLTPIEEKRRSFLAKLLKRKRDEMHLTVHWTVVDVESGQRVWEQTIDTSETDVKRVADSAGNQLQMENSSIVSLAAYRGWQLVSPQLKPDAVLIDLPWFWLGSSQVRKGNGYARQGRWDLAEKEWQGAADQHPTNAAAWHNLAISAVAREDFELARSRLKHADNIARGRTTDKTERWLESQQRSYHVIMGLPEPQEGWRFTD
ncbi:MAG: hypothetical protein ACK5YR_14960 [Pirellula sp.]|jgi:hypothetical protein